MLADWDLDLRRLLALEHSVCSIQAQVYFNRVVQKDGQLRQSFLRLASVCQADTQLDLQNECHSRLMEDFATQSKGEVMWVVSWQSLCQQRG